MDVNALKQQLVEEGFKHVYEWKDAPETEYPAHSHKDKVSFYVTAGAIDFYIEGETHSLKKNDRFDVPPRVEHSAKVGPEGCSYVVGEMIKGDS